MRRLVDDEEVVVFVEDRNVGGDCVLVPGRAPEQNVLLRLHPVVLSQGATVGPVRAAAEDKLRPGAARTT